MKRRNTLNTNANSFLSVNNTCVILGLFVSLLYLVFASVAVVFTSVFTGVVLGQLILAELLELVSHRLLQAHRQGAAEALGNRRTWLRLDRPNRTDSIQFPPLKTYCAVDSDHLQPIGGQLHGSAEVSADMWLSGGLVGGQRQ